MKILQVCPIFPPSASSEGDGVIQVVYNVSRELVARGHEVDVYASSAWNPWSRQQIGTRMTQVSGIGVHYFPSWFHYYTFQLTPSILHSLGRRLEAYDVIHIHDFRSFQGITVAYAALRGGVPYVIQAHGTILGDQPPLLRGLLKTATDHMFGHKIIRKASHDVALSEAEVQQYRAINVSPAKISVVPNGINPLEYSILPAPGTFRSKFNIPQRTLIVLYLGRIGWSKGLDFLVAGFGKMIRSGPKMDVILMLAGPDDGYLSNVKRLVKSQDMEGSVRIAGKLSGEDKISAYVDASVVVNVEPRNVFGLVPLEAAACSRPVIVSNGNAMRNLVLEARLGCAVDYGNTGELSRALRVMLGPDNANQYVRTRDVIMKEYTWGNTVDRLLSMYSSLL